MAIYKIIIKDKDFSSWKNFPDGGQSFYIYNTIQEAQDTIDDLKDQYFDMKIRKVSSIN